MSHSTILTDPMYKMLTLALKLPEDYELLVAEDDYRMGINFGIFKKGELLDRKTFYFREYANLSGLLLQLRAWLKPIINPNLKMFSHIKF